LYDQQQGDIKIELDEQKNNGVDPKVWLLLLLPLAMIIMFVLVYVSFSPKQEEKVEQEENLESQIEETPQTTSKLEGEVYLTLAPPGIDTPDIYRLDLASSKLEPVFEEFENLNYMPNFSSDLEKMIFVRAYDDDTSQILLLDEQTNEISEITSRSEFFLRNPIFSSDGEKIVYWKYENEQNPWGVGAQAEANSIYITTLDGEKEKVANGVYPFFVSDGGEIVFLKDDGLYNLNLDTGVETLMMALFLPESFIVLPEHDTLGWANLRINYSSEDNVLIITDSSQGQIHVFKVDSLVPFVYTDVQSIDAGNPNWPVFHPRGGYFLIKESQTRGLAYSFINFYRLDNDMVEAIHSFDLRDYDLGYIWSADWIVR
jgi:Tol biopolymer transport system component